MPAKAKILLDKLHLLWPQAQPFAEYIWSGAFGTTVDGLPLIGPVPGQSRMFAAYGYGGNGITFSYLASRLIGRLLDGQRPRQLDHFALDRSPRGVSGRYGPIARGSLFSRRVSTGPILLLASSARNWSSVDWIRALTLSGPRSLSSVCWAPVSTISMPACLAIFGIGQHAGIGLEVRVLRPERQDLGEAGRDERHAQIVQRHHPPHQFGVLLGEEHRDVAAVGMADQREMIVIGARHDLLAAG